MVMLLRVFLPRIVKTWTLMTGIVILGATSLEQIWPKTINFLYGFICSGFFYACFQNQMLIRRNIVWIMSYPISRRRILITQYVLSLLTYGLFGISAILSILVVSTKYPLPSMSLMNGTPLQQSAIIIGIFWFVNFFAFNITPLDYKRKSRNFWFMATARTRILITLLAMGFVVFVLMPDMSPFFLFMLVIVLLIFSSVISTFDVLRLGNARRNRFIAILLLIAVAQFVWIYQVASTRINDREYAHRMSNIQFLGWLGPGTSQRDLAEELLQGNSDSWGQHRKINSYLEKFNKGRKISITNDKFLPFEDLLKDKKSWQAVQTVLSIFDLSQLARNEQKFLFSILSALPESEINDLKLVTLITLSQSRDELLEMLRSTNPVEFRYAVVKERYVQDLSSIPTIEAGMVQLSDGTRLASLRTLSILYGRFIGLNDWVDYLRGENKKIIPPTPFTDCDQLKIDLDRNDQDPAILNRCLRKKIEVNRTELLQKIEGMGWVTFPVNEAQKAIIKETLEIKKIPIRIQKRR